MSYNLCGDFMKKSIIFLVFFLIGCTNIEEAKYNIYIKRINEIKEYNEVVDYNLELFHFDHEGTLIYQVIIDEVSVNMENIEMIVTHNHNTTDMFPSIGIFDEKPNLKINNSPKGINLVGYIENYDQNNVTFKIMVKYNNIINYHTIESEQV